MIRNLVHYIGTVGTIHTGSSSRDAQAFSRGTRYVIPPPLWAFPLNYPVLPSRPWSGAAWKGGVVFVRWLAGRRPLGKQLGQCRVLVGITDSRNLPAMPFISSFIAGRRREETRRPPNEKKKSLSPASRPSPAPLGGIWMDRDAAGAVIGQSAPLHVLEKILLVQRIEGG
jgi:hypothetical protein